MNNEASFEAYQWASGYYLTIPLPNNWYDMDERSQDEFLEGHACDMYEYWDAEDIWSEIDLLARDAHKFFSSKGRT